MLPIPVKVYLMCSSDRTLVEVGGGGGGGGGGGLHCLHFQGTEEISIAYCLNSKVK